MSIQEKMESRIAPTVSASFQYSTIDKSQAMSVLEQSGCPSLTSQPQLQAFEIHHRPRVLCVWNLRKLFHRTPSISLALNYANRNAILSCSIPRSCSQSLSSSFRNLENTHSKSREQVPREGSVDVPFCLGKKNIPDEDIKTWKDTKARIEKAAACVLDVSVDVAHETFRTGVELLGTANVVGLQEAARTLLSIWDSLQLVQHNKMACMQLAQRCADIILSVKEEINAAGAAVIGELHEPTAKLIEAFKRVRDLLLKQLRRPAFARYLKREDILREIAECNTALGDALEMFSLCIQIRILKRIQVNEGRRREDVHSLCESLRSARQ